MQCRVLCGVILVAGLLEEAFDISEDRAAGFPGLLSVLLPIRHGITARKATL
jgi:hypothetical protein